MINKINKLLSMIRGIPKGIVSIGVFIFRKSRLLLLVFLYSIFLSCSSIARFPLIGIILRPFLGRVAVFIMKTIYRLSLNKTGVNAFNLIELGIKNIQHKKTRSLVTIGGMALGIGSIVFLLSLGYGVQKLVVSRVTRLDELQQAIITAPPGSKVRIDDDLLSKIKKFNGVSSVLPMISTVGRVNFRNSVSDMAVYGVTTQYLSQSAEKPVSGRLFQSDELARVMKNTESDGVVAGVQSTRLHNAIGDILGSINYSIRPEKWIEVFESTSRKSKVLGLTKRTEGQNVATLVLGSSYEGNQYGNVDLYGTDAEETVKAGKWLKKNFSLWERKDCDKANVGCDISGEYQKMPEPTEASPSAGFIPLISVDLFGNVIQKKSVGEVLGIEDRQTGIVDLVSIEDIQASGSALLSLTEIASESATVNSTTKMVEVSASAKKEAVVNRAMLQVLGIKEENAVGTEFDVSFIASGDLLKTVDTRIESIPSSYKIVGVVPQNVSPFFYVPFIDLRTLGIEYYSLARLSSQTQSALPQIRQLVEGMGFGTTSTADTVEQIDRLFQTVRLVLVALGVIALFIAAMGMFNTLTVSLLERTHEVGLMKTMGMKSDEIEDLFMIESVFMGLTGGIVGLLFGFISGKALGGILTIFSIRSGAGVLDISYIPPTLIIFIMLLSLIVGFITGIYPSQRAKQISALNALRYE